MRCQGLDKLTRFDTMKATTRFPQLQTPVGTLGFCQRVVNLPGFFCGDDAMRKVRSLHDRFHEGYKINKKTGCWLWQGYIGIRKRGRMLVNGKYQSVHRISYQLHHGLIPKGKCICHTCDIEHCVNPNHLWAGTQKENIADCVKKKRNNIGERNSRSKLTEHSIRLIRLAYPETNGPTLATRFGVHLQTIYRIVHRHNWKHIK